MNSVAVLPVTTTKVFKDHEIVAFYESCLSWNIKNGPIVLLCNGFFADYVEALGVDSFFIDTISIPTEIEKTPSLVAALSYEHFPLDTCFISPFFAYHKDIDELIYDPKMGVYVAKETEVGLNTSLCIWASETLLAEYTKEIKRLSTKQFDFEAYDDTVMRAVCAGQYQTLFENEKDRNNYFGLPTEIARKNFVDLRLENIGQTYGVEYSTILNNILCQSKLLQT